MPQHQASRAMRALAAVLVAALPLGLANAAAQADPGLMLVPVSWLAQHQRDADLVLLHVGDKGEYDSAHIPGARFVELRSLTAPRVEGALSLEMLPPAQLEGALEALGISDASRIVVYFGKDWVSPATRIVFTLDYAGLGARTSLLDGGLAAWTRGGHPVTTDVPPAAAPGTLTLAPRTDAIVTMAWLQDPARQADARIVDARNAEFYTGASDGRGSIPRPGHITGAVSLPFSSFFNDDNTLKAPPALDALLASAGVSRSRTTVTYCHIGQQATVPYFVMRMRGYDVRLYDGSFEEWARTPTAPVSRGDTP